LPDAGLPERTAVEPRPDEAVLETICEQFLFLGFETELSEFGARTQAWEAVKRCWHELHALVNAEGSGESSPVDVDEPPSSHHGSGPGAGGLGPDGRRHAKRPGGDDDHDDAGDDGYDGPDDGGGDENRRRPRGPTKKAKTAERGTRFSCPFRKRNPLRFNVRAHPTCATQYFVDMYGLK